MTFAFNKENQAKAKEIIAKYPANYQQSAVMGLLDLAQRQNDNWLSQDAIKHVADTLGLAPMLVLEIASFYTMFNLKPVGKYHLQVCTTTPCWLRGSDDIMKTCKSKLSLTGGDCTKDGKFSLIEVECLGGCVNAPIVQINDDYYEDLDAKSFETIIDKLATKGEVKAGSQIGRQTSAPVSLKK